MFPRRCACPDGSTDCLCARPEILEPVKVARRIRTTEISIDANGITPSLRFQSFQNAPKFVFLGVFYTYGLLRPEKLHWTIQTLCKNIKLVTNFSCGCTTTQQTVNCCKPMRVRHYK